MDELAYEDLLLGYGIKEGDIVDVSSDLMSIMVSCKKKKLHFDANKLIDALQHVLGSGGTIMIRCFSWDFCHGEEFNKLSTPSRVGSLGNYAIKRSDFCRTAHPIYSWMVWGKFKKELCGLNNTEAFGEDSPFAFLYNNHGKHIRLGNTLNDAFTQRHVAELRARVPFRYLKMFKGCYTDELNHREIREYSMYVRRLDIEVGYHPFLKYPDDTIEKTRDYGDFTCASVRIKEATDYIYDDLINNYGINTVMINGNDGYEEVG